MNPVRTFLTEYINLKHASYLCPSINKFLLTPQTIELVALVISLFTCCQSDRTFRAELITSSQITLSILAAFQKIAKVCICHQQQNDNSESVNYLQIYKNK